MPSAAAMEDTDSNVYLSCSVAVAIKPKYRLLSLGFTGFEVGPYEESGVSFTSILQDKELEYGERRMSCCTLSFIECHHCYCTKSQASYIFSVPWATKMGYWLLGGSLECVPVPFHGS